ncbi:MAG: N-6 DNA methylase [Promethearchaeia archaeon]
MNKNRVPNKIIADLEILFKKEEITAKELPEFLEQLQSKEVKNYLDSLRKASKPEQALGELFFSNNSKLAEYLFQDVFPKVNREGGFLDYLIKADREKIGLEIKPLYKGIFKKKKSGRPFKKLIRLKLKPENHQAQILKYLDGKYEYVVLTNLHEWFLFSKSFSLRKECEYFGKVKFFQLLEDFKQVDDFWYYLDKKEDLSDREPLDKGFYKSLKKWVEELDEVQFNVAEKEKTKLIINLINKFLFIQSLDKFWVIQKNFIAEEWKNINKKWMAKNKTRILSKFLEDINEYFFELYGIELFKEEALILEYLNQKQKNIDLFYKKFRLILGVDYGISKEGWIPGIVKYNFRRIDGDILGKVYETYLAEIRKEQGRYYTPKYITNYIVKTTVGTKFNSIISKISENLERKNFSECEHQLNDFFSIKVLDPSCGSGAFLIKTLKLIWKKYAKLNQVITQYYEEYNDSNGKVIRSEEKEEIFKKILNLKKKLDFDHKQVLIPKIILRHIYGNDLDENAIDVAKLNIWLEAIKLSPQSFQFYKVPSHTNHILPNLELNLGNGDSLVNLPQETVIDHLSVHYSNELEKISDLRGQYLNNPQNIEIIEDITRIKAQIKEDLNGLLKNSIKKNDISEELLDEIKPFYWPLEYWFTFFEGNGNKISNDNRGFEIIIGNPPYFTIRGKGKGNLVQSYIYEYLKNDQVWKDFFRSQSDIYYYFIILAIKLMKNEGLFGYIVEDYWIENDYADNLREFILEHVKLKTLIRFGKIKKIFEDADNDTCILIFKKRERNELSENKFKYVYCKKGFSNLSQQFSNEKLVKHITENYEKDSHSDKHLDLFQIEQDSLGKEKWKLSKMNKLEIIEKLENDCNRLGDLCEIGQGVVPGRKSEFRIDFDKATQKGEGYWVDITPNSVKVVDRKTEKVHFIEKEFLKPLVTNSQIKKYALVKNNNFLIYTVPLQDGRLDIKNYKGISGYLIIFEQELKSRYDYDGKKYPWYGYQRLQNVDLFEESGEKIVCPYRAKENRFALDEKGHFGTSDMYAIVPKSNASILYLLGILNSKVLNFWYKTAGKLKGKTMEFFATPLGKMPIASASKEKKRKIENLVYQIITHKRIFLKYREIWKMVSNKYGNDQKTLKKLLLSDKGKIQKGNFEEILIKDVNIYPDEDDPILKKEFNQFRLHLENRNSLKIYGIKKSVESLLLNLEADKRGYRDIIFLEILELLDSRRKVKSLHDFFRKTDVTIIKPNPWENSDNLIRYINKEIKEHIKEKELDIDVGGVIFSLQKIRKLQNLVDALVFERFSLSRDEIDVILNSLEISETEKRKILRIVRSS